MKLRRFYAAALVVAVSSTVTVSAATVKTSQSASCPTTAGQTAAANNTAASNWIQKAVNSAYNGLNCSLPSSVKSANTTAALQAAKTKATAASNCNTAGTKVAAAKDCTATALVPQLSQVLKQVSCKQVNGSSVPSCDNVTQASLPDCFQQILQQCGIKLPGSVTGNTGNNSGSSSSTKPDSSSSSASSQASSSPSSSSSSQAESSTPASSAPSSSQAESSTPSSGKPADSLTFEEQVVQLVNQERAKNGLKALTMNLKLSDVARAKSQDMRDKNYFSHTSPTYGSPFDMMKQFGISYRTAGENIAMGYRTPEAVMQGWMNSSGHRANILNGSFTEIGVGYVADGNYWTQQFIG